MLHQPDPNAKPDILKGIVATRQMHIKAIEVGGLGCADEMLYPENHRYVSDLLAYVAVGARSVEDQQHRLTASGLDIPVGMKNPTSGDISVMINAIKAAQSSHIFAYRGWEVKSEGNPFAHAILRGYVDGNGQMRPNYKRENLLLLSDAFEGAGVKNAACIVDTNHANSGKNYLEQINIAKDVIHSMHSSSRISKLVKGLMIESYLEDGCQSISENETPGRSITDPCLGWELTEKLILDIAKML
jgi:3-deoxy-7-phosphoheptulonate synthase